MILNQALHLNQAMQMFPKVLLYILCGKMNYFKGGWHWVKTNSSRNVRSCESPAVVLRSLNKIAILMLGKMEIISPQ